MRKNRSYKSRKAAEKLFKPWSKKKVDYHSRKKKWLRRNLSSSGIKTLTHIYARTHTHTRRARGTHKRPGQPTDRDQCQTRSRSPRIVTTGWSVWLARFFFPSALVVGLKSVSFVSRSCCIVTSRCFVRLLCKATFL